MEGENGEAGSGGGAAAEEDKAKVKVIGENKAALVGAGEVSFAAAAAEEDPDQAAADLFVEQQETSKKESFAPLPPQKALAPPASTKAEVANCFGFDSVSVYPYH